MPCVQPPSTGCRTVFHPASHAPLAVKYLPVLFQRTDDDGFLYSTIFRPDYIDLFYIHYPDEETPKDKAIALKELKIHSSSPQLIGLRSWRQIPTIESFMILQIAKSAQDSSAPSARRSASPSMVFTKSMGKTQEKIQKRNPKIMASVALAAMLGAFAYLASQQMVAPTSGAG